MSLYIYGYHSDTVTMRCNNNRLARSCLSTVSLLITGLASFYFSSNGAQF